MNPTIDGNAHKRKDIEDEEAVVVIGSDSDDDSKEKLGKVGGEVRLLFCFS